MPPSNSTSRSPPGAEPGSAPLDGDAAPRIEHDDGAGAHEAGAGEPDGDDDSGGDGDGDAGDEGADDGDGFADADDEAGRVASRPGYPAEPAARSRPFGRVSLAPPFASLTARSACPAARFAHRRCRTGAVAARFDRVVHRTSASASGSVLRTTACGSGRTARRSRAAAAPLRRVPRRRFPLRSCSALAVPDRPGRPWFSHPTHQGCPPATDAKGCDGGTVRGEKSP